MTLVRSKQDVARLLTQARAAYGRGEFERVLELLDQVAPERHQDLDYRLQKGAVLARLKRRDEALAIYQAILEEDPNCFEALSWMAVLTRDPRDMSTAIGYAQRAVEVNPFDAAGYNALGSCYLTARNPREAIDAFKRAIRLDPDVAEFHHNLGQALTQAHRHLEAMERFQASIQRAPRSAPNYLALASIHSIHGRYGDAIEVLLTGTRQVPRNAALHGALASAFSAIRNEEAAEYHYQLTLELSTDYHGAYASWLQNQGRFAEATELYQFLIDEKIDPAYGYYGLTQIRKPGDSGGPTRDEMSALLGDGTLSSTNEMYVRYALGRASEQEKDYEAAMAHYDEANRLAALTYQTDQPVTRDDYERTHNRTLEVYERLVAEGISGASDAAPILIVGMIRSGTTLLDQIVSSHPAVASGGELRFWVEETARLGSRTDTPSGEALTALATEYAQYTALIAGEAERHTDKMPLNFANIGLIHRAMPNAKFLHIRRHPVDTCLSIFTTFFGHTSPFAYDKANIVTFYREYLRVMAQWREVLPPGCMLELDYEELIASPETVIPRVIEFCGLPWDEACLHHERNTSAIHTPSRWQARQPIYRTSVARWKRYEPWLGEFARLLETTELD